MRRRRRRSCKHIIICQAENFHKYFELQKMNKKNQGISFFRTGLVLEAFTSEKKMRIFYTFNLFF
jgi:hypothetical protein